MTETNKENWPKMLIVDDDEAHLETLAKLLSKLEVIVYKVNSGHKALSLLLRHEFMLILLDVKMPIMDGMETAQLIRNNTKSSHVPIIFMTAYNKDELEINEGYRLGAIDYLFKPINKTFLLGKVDIFLRFFKIQMENVKKEKETEREKEKEKIYRDLVEQLEVKNKQLRNAQLAALNMMEDANESRNTFEKSEALVKIQAKDLEQFAYTATHDIKTPINNIESYLTLLKKDTEIKDEKSLMAIDWIDKSVSHCKRLIQNLVTVVQVKEESAFDISEINLNEALKPVLHSLQSEIDKSGAEIKVDFSKLQTITYSAPHLESLFLNLLSNAIKYKFENRDLKIKVTSFEEKNYSCFSIEDNGIGINVKRDREKVFGLFKRAHKNSEGTGMGLYIVNETLKKFGGKLDVTSTIGKGSTFTVYFMKQ